MSDAELHTRSSVELPPVKYRNRDPTSEPFPPFNPHRQRDLLPSILARSPPGRSSTLPPIQQRHSGPNRPRKPSVTKRATQPQHKRQKSRGEHTHGRRMSYDGRKAFSAEPQSQVPAYGKRWEDLIDAATTATEVDENKTPV